MHPRRAEVEVALAVQGGKEEDEWCSEGRQCWEEAEEFKDAGEAEEIVWPFREVAN